MIRKYVNELADQMGIPLSRVSVVEGRDIGCFDVYLLHLGVNEQLVSALVNQPELDELQRMSCCERLETKIRLALSRLQTLLQP